jgi:hypothetical protein
VIIYRKNLNRLIAQNYTNYELLTNADSFHVDKTLAGNQTGYAAANPLADILDVF